jgi:FeS assembly SUF system protein
MGLFSFLTGNKDDGGSTTVEQKVEEGAPQAPSIVETSQRDLLVDVVDATPSTPVLSEAPDGWDTGALTAPPPPPSTDTPVVGPPDADLTAAMQGPIIEVIKTVYDPEIPVDIYELGLIYDISVDADRKVLVKMTLTSPACPSAQQLPSEVRYKVKAIPDVSEAVVDIVWEPPWDKDRMSDAAKLQLGFL